MNLTLKPWQKNAAVIVAAVTVVAGVVAGRERPALEVIQEQRAKAADDGINLERLRRGESSLPQSDPFKGFAEQKPARGSNVAEKPSAPPLPFRFFGRLTEKGQTDVFVMQGDELISIKPGQKIGDYRVDQIADASISFTYLPMKLKQTLDIQ